MTVSKKSEFDENNPPEQAASEVNTENADEASLAPAVEGPAQDIHDRVVHSTTFVEDVDLLAQHSLEYKQIMALQSEGDTYRKQSFSQMKRNLLNIIDTHWDLYKKRFSIPDRLVCIKFTCLDGDYFLSLSNGYLCFYQNPVPKNRVDMPLVWPPADVRSLAN